MFVGLREVGWRRMRHHCGRFLCRSGILHGFRYSVVPVLEKNPRELTVQTIKRLASERRRINPWRAKIMITLALYLKLVRLY